VVVKLSVYKKVLVENFVIVSSVRSWIQSIKSENQEVHKGLFVKQSSFVSQLKLGLLLMKV
jgi:hypothetical protein